MWLDLVAAGRPALECAKIYTHGQLHLSLVLQWEPWEGQETHPLTQQHRKHDSGWAQEASTPVFQVIDIRKELKNTKSFSPKKGEDLQESVQLNGITAAAMF